MNYFKSNPQFQIKTLVRECSSCKKTVNQTWGYGLSNKRYCAECVLKAEVFIHQLTSKDLEQVLTANNQMKGN